MKKLLICCLCVCGVVVVEFVFVLMLMIMLVIGVVEFGCVIYQYEMLIKVICDVVCYLLVWLLIDSVYLVVQVQCLVVYGSMMCGLVGSELVFGFKMLMVMICDVQYMIGCSDVFDLLQFVNLLIYDVDNNSLLSGLVVGVINVVEVKISGYKYQLIFVYLGLLLIIFGNIVIVMR